MVCAEDQLPVASCQLPVARCRLPVASCHMPVASCQLPVASCQLPVAGCQSPVTGHQSPRALDRSSFPAVTRRLRAAASPVYLALLLILAVGLVLRVLHNTYGLPYVYNIDEGSH